MVKDKPYLCMCEKWVKKLEAQYGFKHRNWLTFFFFSTQILVLFRSNIGCLDRLSPQTIVFSSTVTAYKFADMNKLIRAQNF